MTEPRPGVDPATNEMRWNEALTEVVQLRTDRAYWKSLTAARTERVNALEAEVDRLRADLDTAQRMIEAVDELHQPKKDDPLSLVTHTYCSCGAMEVFTAEDGLPSIGPAAYPCATRRALSAGSTDPDEGDGDE